MILLILHSIAFIICILALLASAMRYHRTQDLKVFLYVLVYFFFVCFNAYFIGHELGGLLNA